MSREPDWDAIADRYYREWDPQELEADDEEDEEEYDEDDSCDYLEE